MAMQAILVPVWPCRRQAIFVPVWPCRTFLASVAILAPCMAMQALFECPAGACELKDIFQKNVVFVILFVIV